MSKFNAALIACAVFIAACGDHKNPIAPGYTLEEGSTLERVSGNNQETVINARLDKALVVRVVGPDLLPVAGVTVTWFVATGGGSLSATTRITAADGTARVRWTLGSTLGAQNAYAQVAGVGSIGFVATGLEGPLVSNVVVSPTRAYTGFNTVTVHVTWRARDAGGVQNFLVSLPWENSNSQADGYCGMGVPEHFGTVAVLDSGTVEDGMWSCDIILAQSAQQGQRTVSVSATNDASETKYQVVEHALTQNDAVAPVITTIKATPARVYTAQAGAPVTVSWKAVDPAGVGVQIVSLPGASSFASGGYCGTGVAPEIGTEPELVSGTRYNGIWKCTVYLPQSTTARTRYIDVMSSDGASNQANARSTQLLLENDETAPAITAIRFTPTRVYTTQADAHAQVAITWRAVDPAGVQDHQVRLPYEEDAYTSGAPYCGVGSSPPSTTATLVSGTIYDGVWTCTVELPQNSDYRKRRVVVMSGDYGNNFAEVTAPGLLTQNDNVGPGITTITFTPRRVYTSTGDKTVTVTWRAIDPAGMAPVATVSLLPLEFSGTESCPGTGTGSAQLMSGTIFDGIWSCTITLQMSPIKGGRTLEISAYDYSGNQTTVQSTALVYQNDEIGPAISNITFSPAIVNSAAGPVNVVVTWTAKDPAAVYETSASVSDYSCTGALVTGSTTRFRCTFQVPQSAPSFEGAITIYANDRPLNETSVQTTALLKIN